MEIRGLHFDHLIMFRVRDQKENWIEGIKVMEDFPLNHEVYKNGPVLFSFEEEEDGEGLFTYFMPINTEIEFEEGITDFAYLNQYQLNQSLLLRHAQEEFDFRTAYEKVKAYAAAENLSVEDSYICVLLNVYGEYIIDLYVPLKEWSEVQ